MATTRHRKPENWLDAISRNGSGLQEERALFRAEQASEALLMGLRLAEGVDIPALASRFGFAPDKLVNQAKVELYASQGLLTKNGNLVRVTAPGMAVLDGLLSELVHASLVSA